MPRSGDFNDDFEYDQDYFPLHKHQRSKRQAARRPRLAEYVEGEERGDAFSMTYQPARYEEGWLRGSLRGFYAEHLISDVLAQVKGGKEASVYRCTAHARTGMDLVAAKVYRPRMFRNLRNDKAYKQGRPTLTGEGRPVKETDTRLMRALGKKTALGMQVEHTSWLMYEYTTLQRLYEAGGDVPQPIAAGDNAILMSYHGDEHRAAPTLHEVALADGEATRLFDAVLRNVELMLQHGFIHGDLSAYNILYWEGAITIIDFPQVTDSQSNSNARFILQRDIARVCDYFADYGVDCDAESLADDLWTAYVHHSKSEEEAAFFGDLDSQVGSGAERDMLNERL